VSTDSPSLGVDAADLSGLNSYRTRLIIAWTPESGDAERTEMQEEFTREPRAHRLIVDSDESNLEIIQIGETAWYCSAGECSQFQGDTNSMISSFGLLAFDSDKFIKGREVQHVGEETVNGVRTRHYIVTITTAEAAMLSQGEITDVHADVWIADESDLPAIVVRYVQTWKEKRGEVNGTAEYSFETYDVNQPITISPPEGAVSMPEDIPAYPQAKDLFLTEGLATFSTSDDVATVVSFYRTEMEAKGWSPTDDQESEGSFMISWKKDDRTASVIIGPEDDGGTSVTLTFK